MRANANFQKGGVWQSRSAPVYFVCSAREREGRAGVREKNKREVETSVPVDSPAVSSFIVTATPLAHVVDCCCWPLLHCYCHLLFFSPNRDKPTWESWVQNKSHCVRVFIYLFEWSGHFAVSKAPPHISISSQACNGLSWCFMSLCVGPQCTFDRVIWFMRSESFYFELSETILLLDWTQVS